MYKDEEKCNYAVLIGLSGLLVSGSSDLEDPLAYMARAHLFSVSQQFTSFVPVTLAVPCPIAAAFCNPTRLICNNLPDQGRLGVPDGGRILKPVT